MAADNMSAQAYAEFVDGRFDEASSVDTPVVFTNRGKFHAKIVLGALIEHAEKSLLICTGSLNADVYAIEDLQDACRKLKEPIRILIVDSVPLKERTALHDMTKEIADGKIKVRSATPVLNALPKGSDIRHFAIADSKHIRSEQDHKDRTAIVVLNADSPKANGLAENYMGRFESLWSQSADCTSF